MREENDSVAGDSLKGIFNNPAQPIVTVDIERYKVFLDDPSLSEAQKEEFLQALWSIVVTFVDLGFGVHPLQEIAGNEEGMPDEALKEAFDKADGADSNEKNKRDGGLRGRPEV